MYMFTTKKAFEKYFRREILPTLQGYEARYTRGIDHPLRREEWNNYIDMLVREGDLPEKAIDWSCPW